MVPNPSGLNAHETVHSLAAAYAAAARAAGVIAPVDLVLGELLVLAQHGQPVLDDEAPLLVGHRVDPDLGARPGR